MKKVVSIMVSIVLIFGMSSAALAAGDEALLVTGGTQGEDLIEQRLQSLGYEVTLLDQAELTSSSVDGFTVVFISEGVSSANIADKLQNSSVPVVYAEPYVVDDIDLAGTVEGVDFGKVEEADTLSITDASHPIAGNLSGDVQVYSEPGVFAFTNPTVADADVIATAAGDDSKPLIVALEQGSQDLNGTELPVRITFFYLFAEHEAMHTDAGWELFDRTVQWTAGKLVEEEPTVEDQPAAEEPAPADEEPAADEDAAAEEPAAPAPTTPSMPKTGLGGTSASATITMVVLVLFTVSFISMMKVRARRKQ